MQLGSPILQFPHRNYSLNQQSVELVISEGMLWRMSNELIISTQIQDYRSFRCAFLKCSELLRSVGTSGAVGTVCHPGESWYETIVRPVLFGATTYNVLVAMLQFSAVESK